MKTLLKLLPYIAILILISILYVECEKSKELDKALTVSTKETTHYKNQIGTITAEREVLILDKKHLQEQIEKDETLRQLAKEFSSIKSLIKAKAEVRIDSIKVPFEIKVPCDFERNGDINDKWYKLSYNVNQNGLQINGLEVETDIVAITGFKRKWFWGKETYKTDLTATNPHINFSEVQSMEKAVVKRWYDTTLFKIGVGFIGGALIMK